MKPYENLHDTLLFYGVDCQDSYYISTGTPIFKFSDNPFRMDYYAFCICMSGQLLIEIDNNQYIVNENSFLISAPTTIVRFGDLSDDFVMKLLFFDKNFLLKHISNPFIIEQLLLFQNISYSIIKTSNESAEVLLKLLEYLKEKTQTKRKFTDDIARTIIFSLLLEIAEVKCEENYHTPLVLKEEKNEIYLHFVRLVQENILQSMSVQYYADKLFVSNKYLIEIVKNNSGKTPHQIIDETLLKEAFMLLGDSALTISEIAFKLQFNSISAFGRFFKKHVFISPSEYRIREKLHT